MKSKITDYRGFEISFDTDIEKFYLFSDRYDTENLKPSFASAKKYIDEFIKDNDVFKPFTLIGHPLKYRKGEIIRILGIRKDNRFVYEDAKGLKKQISEYEEEDYIFDNQENYSILKEIERFEVIQEEINSKIKYCEKQLIIRTLKDYKYELLKS